MHTHIDVHVEPFIYSVCELINSEGGGEIEREKKKKKNIEWID